MFNQFEEIHVRTLIKASVVPLMFASYIAFPIWLLLSDQLLSSAFAFLVVFAIPLTLWTAIDMIIPDRSLSVKLASLARANKDNLLYFIATFTIFWLFLLPLLNAPLVPRGDEPSHVARIMYAGIFLTIRGRLDPTVAGFAIVALLLGLTLLLLLFSSTRKTSELHRLVSFFCRTRVRIFLLFCFGIMTAGAAFLLSSWSVNSTFVSRFGPLQPLLFSVLHLLFGYSDATVLAWRTINLMLMVISAVVIRATTLHIMKHLVSSESTNRTISRVISSLAGWIFLLFPPTIEFSVQIWLTSGVVLFFTLSFYFLVRVLTSSDPNRTGTYIVLLALILGVGSLWKRVIAVEASAIFLFLLVFYAVRTSTTKKRDVIDIILAAVIYACIFLPWFGVVQLGGLVERSYIPNFDYAFPPYLWDYLLRFNSQMGAIFGILAYSCIAIVFVYSLLKKIGYTTALMPIYTVWYVFFNLDDGWTHNVDRFFVPALSLMAISIAVGIGVTLTYILAEYGKHNESENTSRDHSSLMTRKARKAIPILALVAISTIVCVGFVENASRLPEFIDNNLEYRYVPYDPAAEYIHGVIQGNYTQLYSRFGPSSLSFYLNKYGSYPITSAGIGVTWSPDTSNVTTAAFVEYLHENSYRVLALPSSGLISPSKLPGFIGQELIDHPEIYGINDMKEFTFGANSFYVWLLDQ